MRVSVASAGLPGRYAAALFDLAESAGSLDAVAADLAKLKKAVAESTDLARLMAAPQVSRADAGKVMAVLGRDMKLTDLVQRFLGVLAENRRLGALLDVIRQYDVMLAAHRGSAVARVTVAQPLTAAQGKALQDKLKARTGRAMDLDVTVEPSILGGLVVRIGSEQIDASVRTRLERLGQQMKGQ